VSTENVEDILGVEDGECSGWVVVDGNRREDVGLSGRLFARAECRRNVKVKVSALQLREWKRVFSPLDSVLVEVLHGKTACQSSAVEANTMGLSKHFPSE
jgi:hypothetical protein